MSDDFLLKNLDCLEFLSSIPDDSIGHINCDPPYNIGYDGGDNWDKFESEEVYLEWSRKWLEECTRVLFPNRMLILWGTQKSDAFLRLKLDVLNKIPSLVSQSPIHWSYNWGGRTKKNFASKIETAWCFSKGKDFFFDDTAIRIPRKMKTNIRTGKAFDDAGTIPTTLWEGNLCTGSNEAKESAFHPTVKPQFVLKRMILAYSQPGETVLDCFSGSGSTAIAALETGRLFVGCEKNVDYFNKSLTRINNHYSVTNSINQFFEKDGDQS